MRERDQRSPVHSSYRFRLKRNLRKDAARLNISQNKLARACKVSSGYMSQLLSGDRHPGPEVRARLLTVFKTMSFDDLFEEVGLND